MGRLRVPARLRNWKCLALLVVAVLLVAVSIAYHWYTSSANLCRLARGELGALLGCHVEVGEVRFRLFSGIVVRQLELRESSEAKPWASVRAIHLTHRPAALLSGRLEIDAARIVQPRLVVHDDSIARIRRLTEAESGDGGPSPASITVEQGAVTVEPNTHVPDVAGLTIEPVSLSLQNPGQAGALLQIDGELVTAAGSLALQARVDTAARSARVELSGNELRLERSPLRSLLERELRPWGVRDLAGRAGAEAKGRLTWSSGEVVLSASARTWLEGLSLSVQGAAERLAPAAVEAEVHHVRVALAAAGRGGGQQTVAVTDLSARASITGVRYDKSFRAALPEAARDAFDELGVDAALTDVDVRLAKVAGGPLAATLTAELHEARLKPKAFPYPLPPLSGRVRYDAAADTLRLDDVEGRSDKLAIELDGTVALAGVGRGSGMHVRVGGLRLDGELRQALPKELARAWQALGVRGGTVHASALVAVRPRDRQPLLASASVAVEDLALATSPPVDRVTGHARYTAPPAGAAAQPALLSVRVERARVLAVRLQDVAALALLTPRAVQLKQVSGALCGGLAAGRLRIQRGEPLRYEGHFDVEHVDVESLARALGGSGVLPSGWLRGAVEFKGEGSDVGGLELTGTCKIDRGRLYELPLLLSVLDVLSLQLPGEGTVTDAHLEFRIENRALHVDHFLLAGRAQPVDIAGTIALRPGVRFEDQQVDLLFTTVRRKALLDRVPVLGWVKDKTLDSLKRHFLQARATGTLAHPKVKTVLAPVAEPIGKFWSLLGRVTAEAGKVVPGIPSRKPR